jgi:hypothetical protein
MFFNSKRRLLVALSWVSVLLFKTSINCSYFVLINNSNCWKVALMCCSICALCWWMSRCCLWRSRNIVSKIRWSKREGKNSDLFELVSSIEDSKNQKSKSERKCQHFGDVLCV